MSPDTPLSRGPTVALLAAIFVLGVLVGRVSATSRPAVHDSPTAAPLSESDPGRRTGAPLSEAVHRLKVPASPPPSLPAVVVPLPRLSGLASWYAWRPGQAAAGPALRAFLGPDWRGRIVTVCASVCIRVSLTDWCGCPGGRVIDPRLAVVREAGAVVGGACVGDGRMKLWLAYALGTAIGTLAGIVLMLWAIWLDERERPA